LWRDVRELFDEGGHDFALLSESRREEFITSDFLKE